MRLTLHTTTVCVCVCVCVQHDAEFSKLKRERDDLIRIAEELMGRMEQNTQK